MKVTMRLGHASYCEAGVVLVVVIVVVVGALCWRCGRWIPQGQKAVGRGQQVQRWEEEVVS